LLQQALATLAKGYENLPAFTPDFDAQAASKVLQLVAERMQDNYPYYHPQYAGQMLKPPHAIARIAYAMSLWINPNNHALDGGRASSALEKECIVQLGRMYGWDSPLGHLTGGGTMANLEALWVAGRLHPGKRIIASQQAHYTHSRISDVLGMPFSPVAVGDDGRIVVYAVAAPDAKESSDRARRVFALAAKKDLHLAMIELAVEFVGSCLPELDANAETVTCLRSVLMKPEHRDWLARIVSILEECALTSVTRV
jgi:hypothetical protein